MQTEQITQIVAAAKRYMEQHQLSQNQLATASTINEAYVSVMLSGGTKVGNTVIADMHWEKLAAAVNLKLEEEVWPLLKTRQFDKLLAELKLSKRDRVSKTILGEKGSGKTITIEFFKEESPKHTYVITINHLMKLPDILSRLQHILGLPTVGSSYQRLFDIIMKLRDIQLKGGQPILIFDEAENMAPSTMQMIKGLFDGIHRYCAIILVGTSQFEDKLRVAAAKNKQAAPQFVSRFFANLQRLPDVDRKYAGFFATHNVPADLKRYLAEHCNDYRELNLMLEPVIKECAEHGTELTFEAFKIYHNIAA